MRLSQCTSLNAAGEQQRNRERLRGRHSAQLGGSHGLKQVLKEYQGVLRQVDRLSK